MCRPGLARRPCGESSPTCPEASGVDRAEPRWRERIKSIGCASSTALTSSVEFAQGFLYRENTHG